MKKVIIVGLLLQTSLIVGCSRSNVMPTMPSQAGMGMGMNDPYGSGFASTPGMNTGFNDPYATTPGMGMNDPYAMNPGMGMNDPYGTTPGMGMSDPYGTTPGMGFNNPGMVNGMPGTGMGMIDPVTGQPVMDNGMSQQIVSQIQSAGGHKGRNADKVTREALAGISIQNLAGSPLDHRALIIKALLDGWASEDDRNYARQVWNTVMPQQQQQMLSQDAELNKLVTDKLLQGKSNGVSGVISELGKLVGLGN
ncbi:MAG: hypothetical protein IGS03_08385 [Candidatus Sericytochromatia bacterium]|nr:hypothetical protein [Candidatus Sericytochromatia bacterium]